MQGFLEGHDKNILEKLRMAMGIHTTSHQIERILDVGISKNRREASMKVDLGHASLDIVIHLCFLSITVVTPVIMHLLSTPLC